MAEPDGPELAPPLPAPTPTSRPFWDGLAEGRVCIQQCPACEAWIFYPRSRCPRCLAGGLGWREVSGAATLYSWTLCRRPPSPHFAAWTPYLLAVVELAEGVRMTTILEDADPDGLRAGLALVPRFVDAGGIVQLRYAPAPAEGAP